MLFRSWLARGVFTALLFETITGLAITLARFQSAVQWGVLAHTALGALTLLPVAVYCFRHAAEYRRHATSQVTVLGWLACWSLAVVSATGVWLTLDAIFGLRTSSWLRQAHLVSTLVLIGGLIPHLAFSLRRQRHTGSHTGAARYFFQSIGVASVGCAGVLALGVAYHGPDFANRFPEDYSFLYGTNRPDRKSTRLNSSH